MNRTIYPTGVRGVVRPPCSKSYAQRALAAALLCEGRTTIDNLEPCDDTLRALDAITALGARVGREGADRYVIDGGMAPRETTLCTGESGLATRMFTPIAALSSETVTIVGSGSMLRRPVDMMIGPLRRLGASVESDGRLPLKVRGPLRGGETEVDASVSSQFLTGLLMALPLAQEDTILHVSQPNSLPYIAMTVDLASRFGVRMEHNAFREFFIPGGQRYRSASMAIEGDWSGAAFFLVAGAIAGEVTVPGVNTTSLQADIAVIDALTRAGAVIITTPREITVRRRELVAFDFDATHCPDLFPVLSVLAASCGGVSHIRGVNRLRYKESDRAEAILKEFAGLGMAVETQDDVMAVRGRRLAGGRVDSRGDHRIAMAAAVAALTAEGPVTVKRAESVSKSYPRFWDDLDNIMVKR